MVSQEYKNIQIALQGFLVVESLEQLQVKNKNTFQILPIAIKDNNGKNIFEIPSSDLNSDDYEQALHNIKLLMFGTLLLTSHKSLMESSVLKSSNNKNIEKLQKVFSCIRNAPAHGPTHPKWYITRNDYKKQFNFDLHFDNGKIMPIAIDLTNAHGKDIEFSQFGGFHNVFAMITFILEKCK